MNNINMGRVLLGGLLAGLVINIGEYLFNEVLFKGQLKAVFDSLRVPEPSGNFIAVAVVLSFALGIVIVWLYAMIRPRYGPGPKTAICAGLIAWFLICIYCNLLWAILLSFPRNFVVIGIVWCFIEYCLAAIAGAWLYREAPGRSDVAAA